MLLRVGRGREPKPFLLSEQGFQGVLLSRRELLPQPLEDMGNHSQAEVVEEVVGRIPR
jgi:hypothetical protein